MTGEQDKARMTGKWREAAGCGVERAAAASRNGHTHRHGAHLAHLPRLLRSAPAAVSRRIFGLQRQQVRLRRDTEVSAND